MGNILNDRTNESQRDKEINLNNNKIYDLDDLFDTIIFNKNDYDYLTLDNNINDEFGKEKQNIFEDIFLAPKFGIRKDQTKKQQIIKISFEYFNQILDRKLGIIILLSNNEKTSLNRVQLLLNGLVKTLQNEASTEELIKKNCSIFLLNKKYNVFQSIMACADLDENDLPYIKKKKKNSEEQELDEDFILFKTSDFENADLFCDTLINFLTLYDYDNKKYQKKELDNKNNDHNYFINNKINNDNSFKNNFNVIKDDNSFKNNFSEINNDNSLKNNFNEINNDNSFKNNFNEINNDNSFKNNFNEINNDNSFKNNIEDEKIYENFKDDFDSIHLSDKNKHSIKNISHSQSYITEKDIKEAKENLNIEPDEDNEDSTEIIIRYPNTGKRASRRFLKDDKIQYLYNYILSLDDLLQEINYQSFKMSQPFPQKFFEDLDESFENYGLFPDGIIDIYVKK